MSLSSGPLKEDPKVLRQWLNQLLPELRAALPVKIKRIDSSDGALVSLQAVDQSGANVDGEYIVLFWLTNEINVVTWPASAELRGQGTIMDMLNAKYAVGVTSTEGKMNLYFNAAGLHLKYKLHAAVIGKADVFSLNINT